MGVRSTGSQHPTTTEADGHLLEYFRQNFGAGGGGTNTSPADSLTGLTATGGNDQVALTWTAPVGVYKITDYTIQHSENPYGPWTTFSDGVSSTASTTVTGLSDTTKYYFRVAAENYSGLGKYSAIASATTT